MTTARPGPALVNARPTLIALFPSSTWLTGQPTTSKRESHASRTPADSRQALVAYFRCRGYAYCGYVQAAAFAERSAL